MRRWIRTGLLAVAMLSGCASLPTEEELEQPPLPHLAPDAPVGVVDGQLRFRQIFCGALGDDAAPIRSPRSCDRWLFGSSDTAGAAADAAADAGEDETHAPTGPGPAARPRTIIVQGAFSECFGASARPFDRAVERLRSEGTAVETLVVSGRSGSEENASEIADFLERTYDPADGPLLLIGYSKGATDILQLLVDYDAWASRVAAVVSVAGAVGGSPLADDFHRLYDVFLAHLPAGHCSAGDGQVLDSLKTRVRRQWLDTHELPENIRYYSLAAFTTRDRMARALVPTWERLLRHDRRNDGQLLPTHALIPHSTLLGYLNADHWAVAMRLEDDHPLIAHRPAADRFPHEALLRAILNQVAEDVGDAAAGAWRGPAWRGPDNGGPAEPWSGNERLLHSRQPDS